MNIRDGFFRTLWIYFTKVRPAKLKAVDEVMGTDLHGNKYFARRGDPLLSRRRKETRYVLTAEGQMVPYEYQVPIEWEAWLRYTRNDPPTIEELQRNIIQKHKMQERVQEINLRDEKERGGDKSLPGSTAVAKDVSATNDREPFPTYDDLEYMPGQFKHKPPNQ